MFRSTAIKRIKKLYKVRNYDATLFEISLLIKELHQDIYYSHDVQFLKEFDTLCQNIGSKQYKSNLTNFDPDVVVYVATQLYKTGGHTLCIKNFIEAQPHKKHVILITNQSDSSTEKVKSLRFQYENVEILNHGKDSKGVYLNKIKWLQEKLSMIKASQLFLFHHPYDTVIPSAIQKDIAESIYFYHHSDFLPNLGLTIPYIKIIAIFEYEYWRLSKFIPKDRLLYMPLMLPQYAATKSFDSKLKTPLVTASVSSGQWKSTLPYKYSIEDYIVKLMHHTKGKHVLIGNYTNSAISRINSKLKDLGIPVSNLKFIPRVKNVAKVLDDEGVSVFLTTTPIMGGLTIIEALSLGLPIISHEAYISRKFSMTLAYPEAFSWAQDSEFEKILEGSNKEALIQHHKYSVQHFEKHHDLKILEAAFEGNCLKGMAIDVDFLDKKINNIKVVDPFQNYIDQTQYRSLKKKISIIKLLLRSSIKYKFYNKIVS